MRSALKIAGGIVIGFLALIGLGALCALAFDSLARSGSAPLPGVFPPGIPLSRAIPAAMGQSIRRGDLLITPRTYRLTGAYRSELGVEERPPAGAGFLWVLIVVENIGERVVDAPTVWVSIFSTRGFSFKQIQFFSSRRRWQPTGAGGLTQEDRKLDGCGSPSPRGPSRRTSCWFSGHLLAFVRKLSGG
jgi:hypothetical protein